MKVVFATMQFDRRRAQGAERYITMLADGLAARGHEVGVLAGDPEHAGGYRALGDERARDPLVLHLPSTGWAAVRGPAPAALASLLGRLEPDLLHVVSPAHIGIGVMDAARQLGVRTVVTVVDFWWLCPKHTLQHYAGGVCDARVSWLDCVRCIAAGNERPVLRALAATPVLRSMVLPLIYGGVALSRGAAPADVMRWPRRKHILVSALNEVADVIFLSDAGRRLVGPHIARPRQHLIQVGMEARWFAARRARVFDGASREPATLVLGFVGALALHKGPHLLLEAVRRLGWLRTRVLIVGDGADRHYAERLRAAADGLCVEFCGRVPSESMPGILGALDLLVVPSTWPENQPQTVLEALASATPVVASDVAGIREVLSDAALLFEPGSVAALAETLRRWAAAPRPAMPAAPIPTVDEMVDRTLGVYMQR